MIAPLTACLLAPSAHGDGGGIIGVDGDPPSQECTADTCREVLIALVDAEGDFLSFAMGVVSIEL